MNGRLKQEIELDGTKCPYCRNHKILKGYNDLQTTHPEIAKQWNYNKNNGVKPDEVFAAGKYKYWWICEKGHEWEARLYERKDGNNCPYCSNKKVLKGYNDLQTTYPKIAKQWDYSKNKNIKPTEVTAGSNKKAWWKCENGHSWRTVIVSRTIGKNGCPYCSHKIIAKGVNDVMTLEPNLLEFWNTEKNKNVDPYKLSPCSHKLVWWKCHNGHEWKRTVNAIRKNPSCPICKGKVTLQKRIEAKTKKENEKIIQRRKRKEKNSIQNRAPELAKQNQI